MTINSFGREEHLRLSDAIQTALKAVGEEFGVDLTAGGGQIGASSGMVKIQVQVRDTGSGLSGAQAEWSRYCGVVSMKPEHFGRSFVSGGAMYRITGINLSARKYPITAERIFDKRSFKFGASTVRAKFPMKAAA